MCLASASEERLQSTFSGKSHSFLIPFQRRPGEQLILYPCQGDHTPSQFQDWLPCRWHTCKRMHSSLGRRGVHPRGIERQPRVWKEAPTAAELLSSSLKSRHCPEMKVHAGHERTDEDAAEHARVVQLQGSGLARELQQRHGQWASPSHSVQSSGQGTSPRYFRNGNQRPPLLRPTQTAVYIETGQKDSFGGV